MISTFLKLIVLLCRNFESNYSGQSHCVVFTAEKILRTGQMSQNLLGREDAWTYRKKLIANIAELF